MKLRIFFASSRVAGGFAATSPVAWSWRISDEELVCFILELVAELPYSVDGHPLAMVFMAAGNQSQILNVESCWNAIGWDVIGSHRLSNYLFPILAKQQSLLLKSYSC